MKKITTVIILALMLTFNCAYALDMPDIKAKYAITLDANTGNIIYYKNGDTKAYPASLTKLMSAIILDETKQKDDEIIYTNMAKSQPSSAINRDYLRIAVGTPIDSYTVLKCMLIVSANDMTSAVATNIPELNDSNNTQFSDIMNKKAKEYGMNNTHFVTSNGRDNYTTEHYSTPYDLTILTRKAIEHQDILDVIKTEQTDVEIGGNTIHLKNTNKFKRPDTPFYDETCIGGKTGYTDKAGRCLASVFERNGRRMIGIVLGSQRNYGDTVVFEDMKKIIDYSYAVEPTYYKYNNKSEGKYIDLKKGAVIDNVPVEYKMFKYFGPTKTIEVPIILENDLKYYKNDINDKEATVNLKIDGDLFSRKKDDVFGNINIGFREATIGSAVTTTSTFKDIYKDNFLVYSSILVVLVLVVLCFLLIISKPLRKKRRKRRR